MLEREISITGHDFKHDTDTGHAVRVYHTLEVGGRGRYIVEYRYDTGAVAHTKHSSYKEVIEAVSDAMAFGSIITTCS